MAASTLFVDRRESTENESGDFLLAVKEGSVSADHITAELGEVFVGAAPRAHLADEITLFKSLGIAMEDLAAGGVRPAQGARAGRRHRGAVLIPLEAIRQAREALAGTAVRTPLVRLQVDAPAEIWLKLETLQPVNSFKIRGAYNAMPAPREAVAQGLSRRAPGTWRRASPTRRGSSASRRRSPSPTRAAGEARRDRAARRPRPCRCRSTLVAGDGDHRFDGPEGLFVHPVEDEGVMAGNGTIGLELIEDLPDVDTVVVPVGGGGLITGIASAVKPLSPRRGSSRRSPRRPPRWRASLDAGAPAEIDYRPTWIDGAGAKAILPGMWHRARSFDDAAVVTLDEAAAAVRLLAERVRVIAEGAGALALAAALAGQAGGGKVACIVSGGNIDAAGSPRSSRRIARRVGQPCGAGAARTRRGLQASRRAR